MVHESDACKEKPEGDRIILPCQEGGRLLMNLEKEYKATMIGLQKYVTNKDDIHIEAVFRQQNSKALNSVPKEAETYLNDAGTTDIAHDYRTTANGRPRS